MDRRPRDGALAAMVMDIAGKRLSIRHVPGPLGVHGRCSDNRLIRGMLYSPSVLLYARSHQ